VIELLWLLLPAAAASGWVAGRRARDSRGAPNAPSMSPEYFRGLNYLVNEQPDKAIEVFIRMVEVDRETVETHLALGSLYRRRGEVDRAIRIHQNLIARTYLSREQRTQALLELGLDYMRAGLLDRAEGLFAELLDLGEHVVPALRQLMDIYQQEKDWENAIRTARRLERESGVPQLAVIAHYYCELSTCAAKAHDFDAARYRLGQALDSDPGCVRASLMQAELAAQGGDWRGAISAYERVEYQDPGYLSEAIGPLLACYRRLGAPEAMVPYLERILKVHGGVTALVTLTELLREQRGERAAADFMALWLSRSPSMRGLQELILLDLAQASGQLRDHLLVLNGAIEGLMPDRGLYRCEHCGFDAMSLHWQCPGCKGWGTVRRVQTSPHVSGMSPAPSSAGASPGVLARAPQPVDRLDLTPLP
jgi:lipopolysaccharide biosynthesis regulator YciM